MTTVIPLSIPPKSLSQAITSASSSFKLNNIKSWRKNALGVNINLVAGDFGTRAFGCFRNATGTIIEIFELDPATIASASITILKRGLDFNGDLTTETTAYKLDWPAGSVVQIGTDIPQLFQTLSQVDSGVLAPSTTPRKVGDIFVNTALAKVYVSTGTSSSADWSLLN